MKKYLKIIVLILILLFLLGEALFMTTGYGTDDNCYYEQNCQAFYKYSLTYILLFP
jgi:uncharacterized protein YxeA